MDLKLYDTLTREKRVFTPLDPSHVRMYVCGPTVYDFAHIGNARPVIVFDVLFRLLRYLAKQGVWDGGKGKTTVTYVRNITDVDDKINDRAAQDFPNLPLNEAIRKVTKQTEKQFHEDVDALDCLRPTFEPRATEYISRNDTPMDMVRLIGLLISNKNAYPDKGHVLFDVTSMPDYGKLANRSLDEMIAGARVEVAPYKRNPMDFVLWKPSKPGEPSWPSPWGEGRPGWHIECSAMASALLGETFDIHGGGIDLVFPHHENEIAQSRCAFHTKVVANYWMHNGFLQVEGEKMSKSAGNFVTIHELLENWKGIGWSGETLRFNMLRTHYTQPIDWTFEGLEESHKILSDWYGELEGLQSEGVISSDALGWLCDDLNTAELITELHSLRRNKKLQALLGTLNLLGFSGKQSNLGRRHYATAVLAATSHLTVNPARMFVTRGDGTIEFDAETQKEVDVLVAARKEARERKDFAESDRIRGKLKAMGIEVEDTKDGRTKLKTAR